MENDCIAFRMYGKALEGTSEDAYGMDVWAKRRSRLILNERYSRGEYHIDHGDGLDFYHVRHSLGCGGIAPYLNDSIYFSKNYHRFQILDNGPLRSTFKLYNDAWDVAGSTISVTKTISLDAGAQLSRQQIEYASSTTNYLQAAVGIIKRSELGINNLNEQQGIMSYW